MHDVHVLQALLAQTWIASLKVLCKQVEHRSEGHGATVGDDARAGNEHAGEHATER